MKYVVEVYLDNWDGWRNYLAYIQIRKLFSVKLNWYVASKIDSNVWTQKMSNQQNLPYFDLMVFIYIKNL